jgi:hypothetical protein
LATKQKKDYSMRGFLIGAVFLLFTGCSGPKGEVLENGNQTGSLFRAISEGELKKVERLVESGVDINGTIGEGDQRVTPLIAALVLHKDDIAAYLVERGADVRQFSHFYSTEDYARHTYASGSPALKAILNKKVAE